MPTRFFAYRMQDGVTPLSADYFNPVLADIDTRIAKLEAKRADLQGVIDDLTRFGLNRIDTLLQPSLATFNQMLNDLVARRDALVAELQAFVNSSLTLSAWTSIAYTYDAQGRVATVTETFAGGGNRQTTYTYNSAGRVQSVVATRNGKTRTETYSYNANGALVSVQATET